MDFVKLSSRSGPFLLSLVAYCSLLISCINQDSMHSPSPKSETSESPKEISYLAMGDSYTIGEGEKPENTYPKQVVRILEKEGWTFSKTQILAKTGWTSGELLEATIAQGLKEERFDFVSLLIGVNNQYRGQSPEQFQTDLLHLIDLCRLLVNGNTSRIAVLSIPDWGVTPFGQRGPQEINRIAAEIDLFNQIIKRETSKMGIAYLEITESYRGKGGLSAHVVADGLHPNQHIYSDWARALASIIKTGILKDVDKKKPDER
ncbi:SGNH/GDSL hydrolase family protein [Cyclobacterium jeungdonense]|uniref:GDSL-type esterase/lipase family protein n=1 Tax=Cyclobacterium jeungdonense TaxID=708087 RepID=A0ABT8C3Z5_9BACT|nr:GDSL-type esterase/lipase family protein [Cyclobacterium jeungdonense]MDN3686772.1 GDSL-type esterase/lipase family protein [Cyclobacterium jeungdonense]